MSQVKDDKLFLTEILNDLYRNGFVEDGKAATMLRDWASELRNLAREEMPPSKLRSTFNREIGRNLW